MNLFLKLYNRIKLTEAYAKYTYLAPVRLFGGVKSLAFFAVILLCTTTTYAQTTPVQANLNITAPYPVSLGQYASPINDKLNLTLLFKDQSVGMVDVLFRLSIEGPGGISIQTNPAFRGTPVTLQALLPEQLTGYDLAPYFALENLIFSGGLTKSEYQRTGALPEGFYNFKLQVVHARRTEVVISNTALAPAWLTYSDPPFINLPICGAQIELAEPQYIQFQWMPMHLSSPLAINTEYLLEIVEIRPKERDPNDAMQSTRPVFETTTTSPTYFYGPADPPLTPGMHYAFRVKVLDPDGNLFFKNQGFSVVCNFTYGQENNLLPPDDIAVNLEREKLVRVTWEPRVEASSYKVAYKYGDDLESPWHYIETAGSSAIINDLAYNKAYNFKVQSLFGPYASEWGTPQMATTLPPKEFVCNTETLPVPPTNRIPLQFLWPYDKVQVGHFEMEVLKVRGSNGLFSGLGSMYNPQWGITFKVFFKNIAINELYQLTDGTVHVETEGAQAYIDSFEEELDAQDSIPTDDETPEDTDTGTLIPQDTITIDGVIDSVFVNPTTGDIIVVTEDGETTYEQEVNPETGEKETTLLTDSAGNSWVVDKDGNVSGGSGTGGSGTSGNTNTQLALEIELIKEVLAYYKTEVNLWLDNNEKGPLSPAMLQRMQELPACLPQDAEALQQVLTKIEMYLQTPESLLALIDDNGEDKSLLENIIPELTDKTTPYQTSLASTQWSQMVDMLCPYVTVDVIPPAKIWYNDNLYENGETIFLIFDRTQTNHTFFLKEYQEGLAFNWAYLEGGSDMTNEHIYENTIQTNDNIILELEPIPLNSYTQKLLVTYGTKQLTITIDWEYPEYELKELTAKHGASRIAKSGEVLYLVDPPSATDTKKTITYSIETNPNEVDENKIIDVTWYKNDTQIGSILKFDAKNITRTITEDDNTTTIVKAGYPDVETKRVEVKWVDGNKSGFSFLPPATSALITRTFKEVDGNLKTIDKYIGDTKFKVDAIKIGGTKQNLEDNNSRLYYTKEVGYVSGGITAKMAEVEITHPVLSGLSRMGVAQIGLFAKLEVKISLKGGVERYKYIEEDDYRDNNPFIQFTTGGCIEAGVKAELLVAKQYVDFELKASATACVVGRLKYEFETEKFTGDIYIPPVIIEGKIKISSKGYLEFDLIDWTGNISVTDEIKIYPR